jgi:hypothetical protein
MTGHRGALLILGSLVACQAADDIGHLVQRMAAYEERMAGLEAELQARVQSLEQTMQTLIPGFSRAEDGTRGRPPNKPGEASKASATRVPEQHAVTSTGATAEAPGRKLQVDVGGRTYVGAKFWHPHEFPSGHSCRPWQGVPAAADACAGDDLDR